MNKKSNLLLLLLFFILNSCSDQNHLKEYKLLHYEGYTGICNFIVNEKDTIPILFSSKSNSVALNSLRALKPNVFIYNTSKTDMNLYVIGKLDNNRKITKIGNNRPESEEYYEFEIQEWYLQSPFLCAKYDEPKSIPFKDEIIKRHELMSSDFNTNKFKIDDAHLMNYVRKQ